jgi:hypothetical protein
MGVNRMRRTSFTAISIVCLSALLAIMISIIRNDFEPIFAFGTIIVATIIFLIISFIRERVESTGQEIKYFRLLSRNPIVISWYELEHVGYQEKSQAIELRSAKVVMRTDFRFNGIHALLRFMASELSDDAKREVHGFLLMNPRFR